MIKPAIKVNSIEPKVVYGFVENEIYRAQIFEEESKHLEFKDRLVPVITFMRDNGIKPDQAMSYFERLSYSFGIMNISPINSNDSSFANVTGSIFVHKRNSALMKMGNRFYDVNNPGIFISKKFSEGKEDNSFVGFLADSKSIDSIILLVDDDMNLTGEICFAFEIADIDEYINRGNSFIKNSTIFPVCIISFDENRGDLTVMNRRVFDVPENEKPTFKPVIHVEESVKGMNVVKQTKDVVSILEKVNLDDFIKENFK